MYIVHMTSEFAPIAKVGGLADVVYGLSKELVRQGHHVEILLPKYDCLEYEELPPLKVEYRELWASDGTTPFNNTLWSTHIDGIKILLLETHHPHYFFNRGVIYGCHDDIDRFTYFSKTALEYLFKSGKQPDCIHLHDWPTALVPVLYQEIYRPLGYLIGGTMLTIHNLAHQGKCTPHHLFRMGLQQTNNRLLKKMQDPYALNHVNLLKGGIEYANQITTVSPTYEKEIQTVEGGCGLHHTLTQHRHKLRGILNGIDATFWNPEHDRYLHKKYSTQSINTATLSDVLEGKRANKKHLRARLQLKECAGPLVISVGRLVPQKGPELLKHALQQVVKKGGQCALLGITPITQIHREFSELQEHYQAQGNMAILLDKDETIAHLLFAAADLFLIPSIFEPCGLTQLIALRYGTLPLARRTGGLSDTVFDCDTSSEPLEERNGFTFDFPDIEGIDWALNRAIDCYFHDRTRWETLMLNGMQQDSTWQRPATEYLKLYTHCATPHPPLVCSENPSAFLI